MPKSNGRFRLMRALFHGVCLPASADGEICAAFERRGQSCPSRRRPHRIFPGPKVSSPEYMPGELKADFCPPKEETGG
jgi:hypothetical protein